MRTIKIPYKSILTNYLLLKLRWTEKEANPKDAWSKLCAKYDLSQFLVPAWSKWDGAPFTFISKRNTPWSVLTKRMILKEIQEDANGSSLYLSHVLPDGQTVLPPRYLTWIELCRKYDIFPQELIDRYK